MDKNARNTQSDQMMQRHQKGQKRAFFELVSLWEKPIINYFFQQCRDASLAEDLSQEVFIKVFKEKNYTARGMFSAWIFQIAQRTWIDYYRKQRIVVVPEGDYPVPSKANEATEENLLHQEQARKIYQTLDALSQEDREILLLSQVHDLKYKEVALIMNMPLNVLKGKIYRGLKKFVNAYKGAEHEV